jgi:hypothetical protein
MEQPLELLKSKIADFPGYADDVSRWHSDELVRSYVGEAIADLQQRVNPLDAALGGRIGDMLIRVGFANPATYKTFEDGARAKFDEDAMVAADARAVEVADRAASIDAASLIGYLDEVSGSLDRRDAVMSATSTAAN